MPGVFAAGNVLHVHDLVDYVSEEAAMAGQRAAAYIKEFGKQETAPFSGRVPVAYSGGIRYIVPSFIDPGNVRGWLKIRFRVGDVMQNRMVVLYINGEPALKKKRRIMAPGEMEEIVLTEKLIRTYDAVETIEIRAEEDK